MTQRTSWLAGVTIGLVAFSMAEMARAQAPETDNHFWWPEYIDLGPLRQHAAESSPLGADFDYPAAFASLDLDQLKQEIEESPDGASFRGHTAAQLLGITGGILECLLALADTGWGVARLSQ